MTRIHILRKIGMFLCISAGCAALVIGCSSKEQEQECVDPPAAEKTTKTVTHDNLGRVSAPAKKGGDWCRTCVMGPKGWASCQVAHAEKEGEDRATIKARARERACDDAGFPKGQCPDKAVLAVTCKGDKKPGSAEDPARALQKMFFPKKTGDKETPSDKADKATPPASEKTKN